MTADSRAPARRACTALRTLTALVLGLAGSVGLGCSDAGREAELPGAAPLLVIGVDGYEWDVALELLREGRLPNLAKLMRRGRYGLIETFEPTFSPIIWTTIATGKSREKHGIDGFARDDPSGQKRILTSTNRKTMALWNILSERGLSVGVVGWWVTFPAESVNGVLVSQANTFDRRRETQILKGSLMPGVRGQVHPPARQAEMIALLREVDATLQEELVGPVFGNFPKPLGEFGRYLWKSTIWSFRADVSYHRIAQRLLAEEPPRDLTLVYFGGPDVVGHRFWRYLRPEEYAEPPPERLIENFAGVIPDYYAHVDHMIGELVAAAPPETTILVLSDHGMHADNTGEGIAEDSGPVFTYKNGRRIAVNSANHPDAPPGFFVAAGPHILPNARTIPIAELERSDLESVLSVFDVTPTLLAALRVPLGEDMDGEVCADLFRPGFRIDEQPPAVPTHDTEAFLSTRSDELMAIPGEAERLEQLRGLGYVGDDEEE